MVHYLFWFQLTSGLDYLLVTPENSLYFPAVDFMRAKTDRAAVKMGQSKLPVVVDCKHILEADFTAAKVKEKILIE